MKNMQILKSIIIMINKWINRKVKVKEFIDNTIPIIEVIKHA